MVDCAIITMKDKNNEIIGDFELPLKISINELQKKLIALLRAMENDKYMYLDNLTIEYNGEILGGDDTLYKNAVWDGSIIKLNY